MRAIMTILSAGDEWRNVALERGESNREIVSLSIETHDLSDFMFSEKRQS